MAYAGTDLASFLGRSRGRIVRVPRSWHLVGLSFGLFSTPLPAVAQDSVLTGTVVAARSLVPIQGVDVHVVGTDVRTRTDAAGRFMLRNLTGLAITLELRALGYRALTTTVSVGREAIRLTLTEVAIELDGIVVTGTTGQTEARAVGNAVGLLAAEKVLQDAPIADVQQLVGSRIPGVTVMPYQGNVGTGGVTRVPGAPSLVFPNAPLVSRETT